MNEYPFFLFFNSYWYGEKNIVFFKEMAYSSRYSFIACNSLSTHSIPFMKWSSFKT